MRAAFTLPGLLRRAAAIGPDSQAIVSPEGTVTYGELDERSGRVAAALSELGVERGDRVAVCAPKSPATVAALYGIMRLGAAYVPIDPAAPPLRATKIIDNAGCAAVCADAARVERLSAARDGSPPVPALDLNDIPALEPEEQVSRCESDLAYILYTSGSTGVPKGVMLTHRNALAFVEWAVDRFGVTSEDQLLSHAPFHFDLSVFDLYAAALVGAPVHLLASGEESFGASLAAAVRDRRLTVWYSVPSALVMLGDAAAPSDLETLRVVLFAGEVYPIKHLHRLRDLLPRQTLANLYGPTETNVCTYYEVPADLEGRDAPLPIGRACENQEVMVLDDELRPVGTGQVGELWVRGPTVMQGYWGDSELTVARLQQNPLHDRFPDPTFRTGDLVRPLADGELEFLGRRDHQIKSRGYRIELGEIEAALLSHGAVRDAVVVPVPDDEIGARLIAFVSGQGLDAMALKRHCAERVPRYMVPEAIEVEADLPHTSTGKLDRRALADRAITSPSRAG